MGGSLAMALIYRLKYRGAMRQNLDLKVQYCDAFLVIDNLMNMMKGTKDPIDNSKLMGGFKEGFIDEEEPHYPGINKTPFQIIMDRDWNAVSSNQLKN